jgi:hypothetical protein
VKSADGRTHETYGSKGVVVDKKPGGQPEHYSDKKNGVEAKRFDGSGRPTSYTHNSQGVHTSVQRVGNTRHMETTRTVPGGVEHVVSYGHGGGYLQRPIPGRHGYVQRTEIRGGRSYGAVYHSYMYGHVMIYSPVVSVVYAPAYYGWLLNPWAQPIVYGPSYWGWGGQPWYGYYGSAFVPYATYSGPYQWLTDYLIAANLQEAYDSQVAAGDTPSGPAPRITDEEKALIAQDVRDELARQQQASLTVTNPNAGTDGGVVGDTNPTPGGDEATPVPEALRDHIFTVYAAPLEVQTVAGGTCNLLAGDMLFRTGNAANSDDTVNVDVKSGHGDASHGDLCSADIHARVQLADLQEMYNHKKQLLADGEQKQSDMVGKKHGMPKGPKPDATQVAQNKLDPDTQAAVDALKKQLQEANDTESDVSMAVTSGS